MTTERAEHDALAGLVEQIGVGRQTPSANLASRRSGRADAGLRRAEVATATQAGADMRGWERDHRKRHGAGIDDRVHRLYGLTADEIKVVEESTQS